MNPKARRFLSATVAVAVLLSPLAPRVLAEPQERPLPDLDTLLKQTREHLRDDWRLDHRYTYLERRTEYALGDDGHERVKSVKIFEIRPGSAGGPSRRLIEVDGRRLTPQELEQNEKERQKRLAERQNESPAERQRLLEREAQRRRVEQQTWDDLARVYDFTLDGRERVDGQDLIVVAFRPKRDAEPLTDIGRRMTKVKGRAWISEDDFQVARVDAQVLDDISIGWGILGKLYAGARASYVRRKVDGETWLPLQLSYSGNGRALVKRFAVHQLIEYYDFRR